MLFFSLVLQGFARIDNKQKIGMSDSEEKGSMPLTRLQKKRLAAEEATGDEEEETLIVDDADVAISEIAPLPRPKKSSKSSAAMSTVEKKDDSPSSKKSSRTGGKSMTTATSLRVAAIRRDVKKNIDIDALMARVESRSNDVFVKCMQRTTDMFAEAMQKKAVEGESSSPDDLTEAVQGDLPGCTLPKGPHTALTRVIATTPALWTLYFRDGTITKSSLRSEHIDGPVLLRFKDILRQFYTDKVNGVSPRYQLIRKAPERKRANKQRNGCSLHQSIEHHEGT